MRESEKEMPKTVREVAAIADFRNAEPVGSIRGLARLEKQFREARERAAVVRARLGLCRETARSRE
jgi:hypothetical protein